MCNDFSLTMVIVENFTGLIDTRILVLCLYCHLRALFSMKGKNGMVPFDE